MSCDGGLLRIHCLLVTVDMDTYAEDFSSEFHLQLRGFTYRKELRAFVLRSALLSHIW